jgi:chromosome segregation ATPase
MINLDHVPPIPAMNTAAVQFLDLLADPAAARKLMDDIKAVHDKATAAHMETQTFQRAVVDGRSKLDQDVAAFEQNRKAHTAFLNETGAKLDTRAADLEAREKQHLQAVSALAERASDYETAASRLQADIAVHAVNEQALASDRTVHDGNVEKLRQALSLLEQVAAVWRQSP